MLFTFAISNMLCIVLMLLHKLLKYGAPRILFFGGGRGAPYFNSMCVMLLHKLLKYGAPLRASACGVGWATSQGKHAQARPCSVRDSMEAPEMYQEVFDAAVTHHYLCFDFFNFFMFFFTFFFLCRCARHWATRRMRRWWMPR